MKQEESNKKILIYGSGALGIFVGAKLKSSGMDVTLHGKQKLNKVTDSILINKIPFTVPEKNIELKNSTYDIIF